MQRHPLPKITELFKPFPFNHDVLVGNEGTIFRPNGILASLSPDNIGYLKISIRINGKLQPFKQHRVIALTWVENPDNLPEVNHKNGIKTDNRACNLEWVNHSQNIKHSYAALGRKAAKPMLGKKHNEETRELMRAAKKGKFRIGAGGKWVNENPREPRKPRQMPTEAAKVWLKKYRELQKAGKLP